MEITEYIPFIKEQFQEISSENDMKWDNNSEYIITLQNSILKIEFVTEKYSDTGIGIYLTHKKTSKTYQAWDIYEAKGFQNISQTLNKKEQEHAQKHKGSINYIIYIYSKMLQNHCKDMLSGDFSSVGPGNPN